MLYDLLNDVDQGQPGSPAPAPAQHDKISSKIGSGLHDFRFSGARAHQGDGLGDTGMRQFFGDGAEPGLARFENVVVRRAPGHAAVAEIGLGDERSDDVQEDQPRTLGAGEHRGEIEGVFGCGGKIKGNQNPGELAAPSRSRCLREAVVGDG